MSQTRAADPNPIVREVYDELGALLSQGDDVFIEEGPALLKEAIARDGFFRDVTTDPAAPDEYTREKVIGDPGAHVIRFMEWPPGYTLVPHEHHGRPCFEVLVEGQLMLADFERSKVGEDRYTLELVDSSVTDPGESAIVDPREQEIHSVYSPVRSRSLHVYPEDNWRAFGYRFREEADSADIYERVEFQLREPDQPG
jgi:predicted metal-dependent enzyme (double-stranded beta helix superfamily)